MPYTTTTAAVVSTAEPSETKAITAQATTDHNDTLVKTTKSATLRNSKGKRDSLNDVCLSNENELFMVLSLDHGCYGVSSNFSSNQIKIIQILTDLFMVLEFN